jgi:acetylornithine deacetylase/succinyl-diaminopimelate desuccinylase-like protein
MTDRFIEDCRQPIQQVSESGHEGAANRHLRSVMDRLGFDRTWIDGLGNAIGVIEGKGEAAVMLQGHMDTVGIVGPDQWRFDPHGGAIDQGRIYGRGTSDMKCALMAMACGAADLIPRKNELAGSIVVAGVVCEEEFEGVAQGHVLDQVGADMVLVTHGRSAHSSNPAAGINAVKKMCRLLGE